MSGPKPGALFIQAWVSEVSGVAPRPSWIARKGLSTRPPTPSIAPLPSLPVLAEPTEEMRPLVSMPAPAPVPVAVDLVTSTALAQLADENAALRTQIAEMASTMARLRRDILAASEGELVKLAMTIAGRVVGREIEVDPSLVVSWARECIEQLGAKDDVVIAIARDVRDDVPAEAWHGLGVDHRVQIDAQLASGVIEVRTPEGTIAVDAKARLAAVGSALGLGES